MIRKVFISSSKTATFVCPQCGNVTTADVSKYVPMKQKVTVKCRCKCGHQFEASLEKRHQYRKSVDLPGLYYYHLPNGETDKGIMRVVDISSSGLKLKLNVERRFKEGEVLRVEFHLDDKRRTFMEKNVIVRNFHKNLVGTSFAATEGDDAGLGFYLMT